MTAGLRRHPRSVLDVEESAFHIGVDDPAAALRFVDAVETTMRYLVANPALGKVRKFERADLAGLRSFRVRGFGNHLIFYRTAEQGVEVSQAASRALPTR